MSTASRLGGSLLAAILVFTPPIAELLGLGHSFTFLLVAVTGLLGVAVVAIAAEPRWKQLVLVIGLFLGCGYFCALLAKRARVLAFDRLASRSAPLVAAIEAYSKDHGRPPTALQNLVPTYLPRVPETGMPGASRYAYETASPGGRANLYPGVPWELSIPCSLGFGNGDTFFYWPSHNYPRDTGAGSVDRIRDWAYLHE